MGTSLQGDVTREKIGNFTEKNADFFPIEKSAVGRTFFTYIKDFLNTAGGTWPG